MKILVCGDRKWPHKEAIKKALSQYDKDTIVIHGGATGADSLGGEVAKELEMAVQVFPADWDQFGRRAGMMRNLQMLDEKPDLVLAFHNFLPNSKGTKHTVTEALKRGIKTELWNSKGVGIHLKKEDADGQI